MPAYNCEKFIRIAIKSILNQSYKNWEAIIIDDYSTDKTADIIMDYADKDKRIKFLKLKSNSGAAVARNMGINIARGEYIAFLDSDDYWKKEKLHEQIKFMKNNHYNFTCTNYAKINENGDSLNKIITSRMQSNYSQLLETCPGNSTVIYNANILGKYIVPDIKKRNDYLMWLQIIKKAGTLYGYQETLSTHRIRTGSISKGKFGLIKYHWEIYREFERLTYLKSIYLVFYWISKTITSKLSDFLKVKK